MSDRPDIRQGTCPQCGHEEIIEAQQHEFTNEGNRSYPTCVMCDERWDLPGRNPGYGHGPLCLYVCRRCGFCQWYAHSPGSIPISDEHRTRLIKGGQPAAGPNRQQDERSRQAAAARSRPPAAGDCREAW
jgi:hypothetical protein